MKKKIFIVIFIITLMNKIQFHFNGISVYQVDICSPVVFILIGLDSTVYEIILSSF